MIDADSLAAGKLERSRSRRASGCGPNQRQQVEILNIFWLRLIRQLDILPTQQRFAEEPPIEKIAVLLTRQPCSRCSQLVQLVDHRGWIKALHKPAERAVGEVLSPMPSRMLNKLVEIHGLISSREVVVQVMPVAQVFQQVLLLTEDLPIALSGCGVASARKVSSSWTRSSWVRGGNVSGAWYSNSSRAIRR